MKIVWGCVLVLSLALSGVARGEMYRYTDSKGGLHFVDDIAKVPKKYRKQVRDAEPQGNVGVMDATPDPPQRKRTAHKESQQQSVATGSGPIEVFTTSWCGYCKKMIRFLNDKGIPYTAYDIEKDSAAAQTYRELGGRGVPVVRVGSHVVHGYSPQAVMAYYNGGQ
ncbi:MAG TPA: glutaredoxin domain-containing protein [Geobacteraceae bacterium]